MADISFTAGNVKLSGSATSPRQVQFGEAVTQGQSVYLKASDGQYWLADANLSVEASMSVGGGVVLTPASAAGYGLIVVEGLIDFGGAVLTAGGVYVLSNNLGGIAPNADAASGWNKVVIGTARTTAILNVKIWYTGAVV
jgi:hypothetical protein